MSLREAVRRELTGATDRQRSCQGVTGLSGPFIVSTLVTSHAMTRASAFPSATSTDSTVTDWMSGVFGATYWPLVTNVVTRSTSAW